MTDIFEGRPVSLAVVHCSATRPEWFAGSPLRRKIAEIRKWHTLPKPEGRGWSGIGYNWLIDRDGTEAAGRDLDGDGNPWDDIGAHVAGKNTISVGICLIGGAGSSADDSPYDHFTPEQLATLRARLDWLRKHNPAIKIEGHNAFAAKACPGFRVPAWYSEKNHGKRTMGGQKGAGGIFDLIARILAWIGKGRR